MNEFKKIHVDEDAYNLFHKLCSKEEKFYSRVLKKIVNFYSKEKKEAIQGVFNLRDESEEKLLIDESYDSLVKTENGYEIKHDITFSGDIEIKLDNKLVIHGECHSQGNILSAKSLIVYGNLTAHKSIMCADSLIVTRVVYCNDYIFAKNISQSVPDKYNLRK